jgi:multidrug efflux pump subunit AcrB
MAFSILVVLAGGVRNRVSIAQAHLPQEVQALGVSTLKQSPNLLMVVNLVSPDGTNRPEYVSNYALTQVKDPLSRLYGLATFRSLVSATTACGFGWIQTECMDTV